MRNYPQQLKGKVFDIVSVLLPSIVCDEQGETFIPAPFVKVGQEEHGQSWKLPTSLNLASCVCVHCTFELLSLHYVYTARIGLNFITLIPPLPFCDKCTKSNI